MDRRQFLASALLMLASPQPAVGAGTLLAASARSQLGVTLTYDPRYTHLNYPGGDVPRSTGVCADVVIRAGRDGLNLDLQKLVHEDMLREFAAYPKTWGVTHPDANIDHRRVLNLEIFWRRAQCELWRPSATTAGDAFPKALAVGDILTWRLDARLPHIGIVVEKNFLSTRVVHNWGNGAEESSLSTFAPHRAAGHFRWPAA